MRKQNSCEMFAVRLDIKARMHFSNCTESEMSFFLPKAIVNIVFDFIPQCIQELVALQNLIYDLEMHEQQLLKSRNSQKKHSSNIMHLMDVNLLTTFSFRGFEFRKKSGDGANISPMTCLMNI